MKLRKKLSIIALITLFSLMLGFGFHFPFQLYLVFQTVDIVKMLSKKINSKSILVVVTIFLMITSKIIILPYFTIKFFQLIKKKHLSPVSINN